MAGALRTCVSTATGRPSRSASSTSTASTPGVRAAPHQRARLHHEEAVAHTRARRARVRPRGGFGEPEEPAAGHLRAVPRAGRTARRRRRGASGLTLASGRAARGPDRQRIRNAADASRSVGGAARPAAVHGGEGRAHARQPARDPGQDAGLREVRPGARVQPAASTRWGCRSRWWKACCRARLRCRPSRFLRMKRVGQPARLGPRRSRPRRDRRRHLPEPDPGAVAPRPAPVPRPRRHAHAFRLVSPRGSPPRTPRHALARAHRRRAPRVASLRSSRGDAFMRSSVGGLARRTATQSISSTQR